jgi:quercetin dioxygenase-like cupin family protein
MEQQPSRTPGAAHPSTNDGPLTRAVFASADVNRWGEAMRPSAEKVWTKVSGKDTAGAWSAFESLAPAGFGVPLHLHPSQEEWFWVLSGELLFEVGGERYHLTPGSSLLAPRKIPHRWKNTTESVARFLIVAQPTGGLEEFFDEFALLTAEQLQDFGLINALFARCEMEVVGPPLE